MIDTSRPVRSIIKGFTWRCISTIITIILASIFIDDIKIIGVIGVLDFVIKWFLFFIHERWWHKINWGKR